MRIPAVVLSNLASKAAEDKEYKFDRLYRNLFNPHFFLVAYDRIHAKTGNMTEGVDGRTVDGMSLNRINQLIEQLKDETYQPKPVRRTYIPKKNGKVRPLGIPSFDDKLVQEVVRAILESIYEPTFTDTSHGFRPERSCHTALAHLQRNFHGVKWFIEGDISSFFDNIDHHVLISILRKRIKDERFIRLIWKFLRAGYLEDWKYNKTYSGTPQGGIVSPILANIYLNELDKFMESLKEKFDKGKKRKANPEYQRLMSRRRFYRNELKKNKSPERTQEILAGLNDIQKLIAKMHSTDQFDTEYKRLQYVRYADDFIVGIIGNKEDAKIIKEHISDFLQDKLKLTLSEEKTLITHGNKMARFLGHDVTVSYQNKLTKDKHGTAKRTSNGDIRLYVPKEKWVNKLKELRVMKIESDGKWKPMARAELLNVDDLEILATYNAEIRGLYNFYKYANNVSVLNKFHHIMKYSMLKTLAGKYKKSVYKICKKYNINGEFGITYQTKEGQKTRFFYNEGFKKQTPSKINNNIEDDYFPITLKYMSTSSLIERLTASKCEWCKKEGPVEIHHVRKLKDLKGKKRWEKVMIARKRKTIPLCKECHDDLHAGRLD